MKKYYLKRSAMALVLTFVLLFTSCSYRATYPDYLTLEYCEENYVYMESGLIWLQCAENPFAEEEGEDVINRSYFGIKGIDYEKFLACESVVTFSDITGKSVCLMTKKENEHFTAWLDCTVTDVELFWGYCWGGATPAPEYMDSDLTYWEESELYTIGNKKVCRKETTFNASEFISDIRTKYENKDYRFNVFAHDAPITREVDGKTQFLQIRLKFKEYKNIVYDAYVIYDEKNGVEVALFSADELGYAIKIDDKFAKPILKIINSLDK